MIPLEIILREVEKTTIVHNNALKLLYYVCQYIEHLLYSVAECGVYKGGTLRLFARCLPDKKVWGFDTFTGIPVAKNFDTHEIGDFGDTSYHKVSKFLKDLNNVYLVQGVFPKSFEQVPQEEKFCLIHLDCDQYDSHQNALNFFLPRLVEGGLLVVDDYIYCTGAQKAIDERFPEIKKPPYIIYKNNGYQTIVTREKVAA